MNPGSNEGLLSENDRVLEPPVENNQELETREFHLTLSEEDKSAMETVIGMATAEVRERNLFARDLPNGEQKENIKNGTRRISSLLNKMIAEINKH